jgi:tetratricopeptide (TPR) repeat protein
MRRPLLCRAAAAAVLLAGSLGAAPASAQAPPATPAAVEQARARFRRGVALYKEGDYRAALNEFRRARELAPNPRLLYNIAQAHAQLHDYGDALRAYIAYLAEGGESLPAERRAAIEKEITKLSERVAKVDVKANPGAEIAVDDLVVGRAPLAQPLYINAGRRKLSATSPGGVPVVRVVDFAGGDDVSVSLAPPPLPQAPPREPPGVTPARPVVAPAPRPPARGYVLGWVGVATTASLAAGATVTGLLALAAQRDYEQELESFPGDDRAVDAARRRTRAFSLVADVLGVAAVGAGAATAYLWLSRPSPRPDGTAGRHAGWRLRPGEVTFFLHF